MELRLSRTNTSIWWHRFESTLAKIMACCLIAPGHYMNQCWLIISKVQWHLSEGNFTRINHKISFEITCIKFHPDSPGMIELMVVFCFRWCLTAWPCWFVQSILIASSTSSNYIPSASWSASCIYVRYAELDSHQVSLNTLGLRKKWPLFSRQHFQMHFFNENVWILIQISLSFVPNGSVNNIPIMSPAQHQAITWTNDG